MHPNQGIDMSLLNLNRIPQYQLPDGYDIRNYYPGDKAVWYKIHRELGKSIQIRTAA